MLSRTPLDKLSAQRTTLHAQETDTHAPSGIQTCNPSKRVDADPCLRLRGHLDRGNDYLVLLFKLNVDNYAALNLLNYQIQHKSISIVSLMFGYTYFCIRNFEFLDLVLTVLEYRGIK